MGQRRQVALARALIHRPDLLVWNGLSGGLDTAAVRDTLKVLRAQRGNRPLTLIATGNRADALGDGCDQVAVLERGRLIFDGSPAALTAALPQRLNLRYVLTGRPVGRMPARAIRHFARRRNGGTTFGVPLSSGKRGARKLADQGDGKARG